MTHQCKHVFDDWRRSSSLQQTTAFLQVTYEGKKILSDTDARSPQQCENVRCDIEKDVFHHVHSPQNAGGASVAKPAENSEWNQWHSSQGLQKRVFHDSWHSRSTSRGPGRSMAAMWPLHQVWCEGLSLCTLKLGLKPMGQRPCCCCTPIAAGIHAQPWHSLCTASRDAKVSMHWGTVHAG